jgi:hypothetical protein
MGHAPLARLSRTIHKKTLLQASVVFGESQEREIVTPRPRPATQSKRRRRTAPRAMPARDRGPLPSPTVAASDDGPFTPETALRGPLALPVGAARGPELDALSRRAAIYATRAGGDGTRRV